MCACVIIILLKSIVCENRETSIMKIVMDIYMLSITSYI